MAERRRWKIWYGNGSTFSDAAGPPGAAPPLDVQVIAQADPDVGRLMVCRKDFYVFHDGEWYGVDWFGLLDHLMALGIVKAGRTRSNRDYDALYRAAVADPDLAPKSARHWLEDPPPGGDEP